MPNNKKISNIQEHHSLGEYQRYFSHLLRNGKLKRYPVSQKNKLDPNRQYWKIKDEKGETFYYEVPKYIKPESTKSAYSLSRVMHRRPARAALAIFGITAIFSITSAAVAKKIFVPHHFPDIPPQPVDLDGLQKKLHDFQEWKKEEPTGDATKKFSKSDLGSIAIANALYDPESYREEEGKGSYERRSLLTVGFGNTVTSVPFMPVYVAISNAFIYQNGNALEESISYSEQILAPKVGRRDFFKKNSEDGVVTSNSGNATSSVEIKWIDEDDKPVKSKKEYIEEVGKYPDNPFLYSVDEETVLEDSIATKVNNGYTITLNLDTKKGVAGYVKRIKYLSGKDVTQFLEVKLTFNTDENLQPITIEVNESYKVNVEVLGPILTTGKIKTTFYYEDVPNIPARKDSFDYSKYKA